MLKKFDTILAKEEACQQRSLNMIAPSNVVPKCVRHVLASNFTNVVGEGYRPDRYHSGTENYDELEELGEDLAKQVFGGYYANLKPHSATQAVQAAFLTMKMDGRSRVLSMNLKDGGHVTHANITQFNQEMGFHFVHYGVSPNYEMDYEHIRNLARQEAPDIIVAGASAFPKKIHWSRFREIADEVGACFIADVSHYAGLIAGNAYPGASTHADIIVLSTSKTLPGPKGGIIILGRDPDQELEERVKRAVNFGLQSEDIANAVAAKVAVLALTQDKRFSTYAQSVVTNARTLCDCLQTSGIPVVGFDDTTKGTDSHIVLIDVRAYHSALNGQIVSDALARAGVYANKNPIRNDPLGVDKTSGVRFGTAGISILGMGDPEVRQIASIVKRVISSLKVKNGKVECDDAVLEGTRTDIAQLRSRFPATIFDR